MGSVLRQMHREVIHCHNARWYQVSVGPVAFVFTLRQAYLRAL